MELLTNELDGFNRALNKLQRLTKNVEDIRIIPDTEKIELMLEAHLSQEKEQTSRLKDSIHSLEERLEKASVVSKFQKWFHYSIWVISLIIIGYLSFKVSRMKELQEESFELGQQEIIENLQGYFNEHPVHLKTYLQWKKENDSVPSQK